MNRNGRDFTVSGNVVGNHKKLPVIPAKSNHSPSRRAEIPFLGMAENILYLGDVKTSK